MSADIDNTYSIPDDPNPDPVVVMGASGTDGEEAAEVSTSPLGTSPPGDRMIFGPEQITVCVTLLLFSLIVLSPSTSKIRSWRSWYMALMCPFQSVWCFLREKFHSPSGVEAGKSEGQSTEEVCVVPSSSSRKGGTASAAAGVWSPSSTSPVSTIPDTARTSGPTLHRRSSSLGDEVLQRDPVIGESSSPLNGTTAPSASLCTGMVLTPPPPPGESTPLTAAMTLRETEHDKFVRNWPRIHRTAYRKLVLPPECKKVDPPKKPSKKRRSTSTGEDDDDDDENPLKRWLSQGKFLYYMIKGVIMTYDYADAAWTVFAWIMKAIRLGKLIGREDDDDEEEEEEEDVSVATEKASSFSRPTTRLTAAPIPPATAGKSIENQTESPTVATEEESSLSDENVDPKTGRHVDSVASQQQQHRMEFEMDIVSEEKKDGGAVLASVQKENDRSRLSLLREENESVSSYGSAKDGFRGRSRGDSLGSMEDSGVFAAGRKPSAELIGGAGGEGSAPQEGAERKACSASPAAATDHTERVERIVSKAPMLRDVGSSGGGGGGVTIPPSSAISQPLPPPLSTTAAAERRRTKSPTPILSLALSSGGRHGAPKRRDALESYRSRSNVPNPSIPPLLPPLNSGTTGALKHPLTTHSNLHPHFSITPQSSNVSDSSTYGPYGGSGGGAGGTLLPTIPSVPASPEPEYHHSVTRSRGGTGDGMNFFDAANSRDSLQRLSREVPVPDKNGYILGDEFLADSPRHTPLLVFVNSRSGPQQGQVLITQFRRLLNPIQVWDLADGGPEVVLESFRVFSRLRILVCGGDGTVSWIISALEKMKMERWPPIAILPLGTGNDLARIHGWGGGYNNESLLLILEQVAEAYVSLLDRWEMSVVDKKGRVKDVKEFFNYLGVGVDAQAALQVHMLRESKPKLFFSRAVNKAWYAIAGAEDAIKSSCADLPERITLMADGVEVPLPADSQGIIFLNIDSYTGGVELWSQGLRPSKFAATRRKSEGDFVTFERRGVSPSSPGGRRLFPSHMHRNDSIESIDEVFFKELTETEKLMRVTACDKPSSCQDGMLDVVSIRGTFHLGQIRVGLSNAQLLCQCKEATITLKKRVAVQIDGEPWRQNSCTLKVKRKPEPAIMLHRSPEEGGGVETEMAKLLDWAEERRIIDRNVHATLMKEFSRRIENKTRQRRVRSQENLMFSAMSRAIANSNPPSF